MWKHWSKICEKFSIWYCGFRKNYYLCIPIIEDDYAQPADTQLVRDIVKYFH